MHTDLDLDGSSDLDPHVGGLKRSSKKRGEMKKFIELDVLSRGFPVSLGSLKSFVET